MADFRLPRFTLAAVFAVVAILPWVAGCTTAPSSAAPSPRPAVAPASSASTFAPASAWAPPWTEGERAAARQAVLQGVDPKVLSEHPAVGDLGPVLFEPVPGRARAGTNAFLTLYSDSHEIKGGAVGERIEVHQSWLRRGPAVAIEEGRVHVRFETLHPVGPVELDLGFDIWGPRFSEAVYRHVVRSEPGLRTTYDLSYPVAKMVRPKYDVAGVRQTGRGVVVVRIQAIDSSAYTTRVDDRRVAFRCNTPCGPDDAFVQLPTVALGPFVDQVGPSSAIVSFETDAVTHGAVLVKTSTGAIRLVRSRNPGVRHEVDLGGLTPGRRYRYLVVAVDRRGEVVDVPYGTFRTPPRALRRFRFAVMSDSRSAPGGDGRDYNGVNRHVLERLMQQAVNDDVEFAVFAGDLIDGYVTVPSEYRRQLRAWMESVAPLHMHVPVYEIMGNHELLGDAWTEGWMADRDGRLNSETLFAAAVVNPRNGPDAEAGRPPYEESVYSFDYGAAHFAMVNSNHWHRNRYERTDHPAYPRGTREGMVTDAQLDWLDADLAAARARGQTHLFVFTHEPAFPTGGHAHDAMYYRGEIPEVLAMRDRFWGLLVKHDAVAAFFGDEHNYSRTLIDETVDPKYARPVWNIITGGAGAPYYARDFSVPWKDAVRVFEPDHHLLVVTVDGSEVRLVAKNLRGEVIDEAVLTRPGDSRTRAPRTRTSTR